MQTFMPYSDYAKTASVLSYKHLGKQRVETYQVLMQLLGMKMVSFEKREWEPRAHRWHHPAMSMWAGHELELLKYQQACCEEWVQRGYADTCLAKSRFVVGLFSHLQEGPPAWIGDEKVHESHRANLLRKHEAHYGQYFPEIDPTLPYVWPVTSFEREARCQENFKKAQVLYSKR